MKNSQESEEKRKKLGKKEQMRSSRRGSVVNNLLRNHEVEGSIPSLAQWVKDLALL